MALALRLNELAAANAQGLLDDDEYRLLRQDAFERYSGNAVLPVEVPVVPHSASTHASTSTSQLLSSPKKKQVEFAPSNTPRASSPSPPSRAKSSVTSGVASLIRRATGRRPSVKDYPAPVLDAPPVSTTISLKRALIPHLTRKASIDMTSINSTSTCTHPDSISSFSQKSYGPLSPPMSPSRSGENFPSSSTSKISLSGSVLNDGIFDDGGFSTTREIRQAIFDLEAEGKRLVDAFDELEQSAIAKWQGRSRHGPATSTTALPVWPTTAPPATPRRVRSDSTPRPTYSTPSSMRASSARKQSKAPLTTPPSIRRKNSSSSIASHASSLLSVTRFGSIKKSRSTSHLPLTILSEDEPSSSQSHRENSFAVDDAEVADVRRRKLEVIGRYEARLEYLRARLKGAELHERLLKK